MVSALSVLIIEDDDDTRANLRDILELDGYCVETAASAGEARERHRFDERLAI